MQSLNWYRRRLLAMSPGEIIWRLKSKLRDQMDRRRAGHFQATFDLNRVYKGPIEEPALCSAVVGGRQLPVPGLLGESVGYDKSWKDKLLSRADKILDNRITLFDLEDHDLGARIDWNYEYKAGQKTPLKFAADIDYRDYAESGDCKFAWELSRFQHAVALGRAYRLTADRRYAEAVVRHFLSWIEQCPYPHGMQWRSPLELGIRLINWVWALEMVRPSGLLTPAFWRNILPVVYFHLFEITRKYSRFSSANNHLIGEATGVFVASSYFSGFSRSEAWRKQSWEILRKEIIQQTYPDGGTREQAMGYQLFVMEFFMIAALVAKRTASEFPASYVQRLERMYDFLGGFIEGGDTPPMFGDADDGYVLDLGTRAITSCELLATGATLYNRPDLKRLSRQFGEPAFWLLGAEGWEVYRSIDKEETAMPLVSRGFRDAGYYLLQCGHADSVDRISVSFDCGELGFGPIAAHGHADALSVTLRIGGHDVLVDCGTYDYFTYRCWRDFFRGTGAHNTIVVEGRDQSEMLGPFLWGRRALSRSLAWEINANGATVAGEHDGYARLPDPVIHRRKVLLDGQAHKVSVLDELLGAGNHHADIYFHLAEGCDLRSSGQGSYLAIWPWGGIEIVMDPVWSMEVIKGGTGPILGWMSRSYHCKRAIYTLVGSCSWRDQLNSIVLINTK